jgi:hypothetical protein
MTLDKCHQSPLALYDLEVNWEATSAFSKRENPKESHFHIRIWKALTEMEEGMWYDCYDL